MENYKVVIVHADGNHQTINFTNVKNQKQLFELIGRDISYKDSEVNTVVVIGKEVIEINNELLKDIKETDNASSIRAVKASALSDKIEYWNSQISLFGKQSLYFSDVDLISDVFQSFKKEVKQLREENESLKNQLISSRQSVSQIEGM